MIPFRSVVLDVDSTVSSIEGVDWLAALRAPEIAERVAALTNAAMDARVPLDSVYAERLSIIRPTRTEIAALGQSYIIHAVAGVREAVSIWRGAGLRVVLVSGGLRDAILPLASWLGIAHDDVYAVDVAYDDAGVVTGTRGDQPLAMRGGKPRIVAAMALARPSIAVGDGATDAELVPHVDRFIAFTGVVRRDAVVAAAAMEIQSFAALIPIVLGA